MKHEFDSGKSNVLEGVGMEVSKQLKFLFKEAEISESIQESLSTYISNSIKKLNPGLNRGNVDISSSMCESKHTQDSFGIWFTPSEDDKNKHISGLNDVNFIQCIIGEGKFLNKEIEFFEREKPHPALYYLNEEYIPFLKELFKNLGFKISEKKNN